MHDTIKQFKWEPSEGFYLHAVGKNIETAVDDDGMPIHEFVPEERIEAVVDPAPQSVATLTATTVSTSDRFLLNTTKSTYHAVDCTEAVSGSLRTLEEIAALNPDAKPCGKCQPPELLQPITGA